MKLSTRARRALCFHRDLITPNDQDPPRSAVAMLSFAELKETENLGRHSLAEVIAWLAEEGLEPLGGMPKKSGVSQSRLDDAVALLERHGYTVTKP